MSVHPLHGSRSTPLVLPPSPSPMPAALGVHPAWGTAATQSVSTSSVIAQPALVGNSPSFGRRWAASNFGSGPVQEGYSAATPLYGGGDDGVSSYGQSRGDALDVFSREHVSCSGSGGRQPAPWEGPGQLAAAAVGPLGSRGGYSSRPPWAVDDSPTAVGGLAGSSSGLRTALGTADLTPSPVQERLGTGASSSGSRGPLQTILNGGTSRDGGESGPHTRALQQQVAALQVANGAMGGAGGRGALQTPPPATPPWGTTGTPDMGSRLGSTSGNSAAGGRSAARIMAVAQRSGAGAADCLVW